MNLKITLTVLFLCFQIALFAQVNGQPIPGALCINCGSKTNPGNGVMNGNETINTTYTATACGLNYVTSSFHLNQRSFANGIGAGATQPAPFVVSGIPACGVIYKAFLYAAFESNGAPSVTASVTNPVFTNSLFPMTQIGIATDKNWGYANCYSHRADVTSIISGNGTYTLSGFPVNSPTDVNGATLFIIYRDVTQNYTGSIVIADGMISNTGPLGDPLEVSISGFNVCGTTLMTTNFMIVDDLQRITNFDISLNTSTNTINYTEPPGGQVPWMFFSQPGAPAFSAQTSATYGGASNGDAFGIVMAGMYYRTFCLSCPTAADQLTLSATSTPSCLASASVAVTGGTGPYTYTWTGTAQTTSVVTGLSAGNYTVRARDTNSCVTGSATLVVTTPAASISINTPTPVCKGFSVGLVAGSAVSYTWSPGTYLNSTSAASVIATPIANIIYTLSHTNALGCKGSQTIQVSVVPTQTFSATDRTICAGQTLSLSTGMTGNVYSWNGPNAYVSSQQNPLITNATSGMSGVYNASVTTSAGCVLTTSLNATVLAIPSQTFTSNSPICAGNTLSLTSSNIGISYSWTGPNNYSNNTQNFSITNTGTVSAGTYSLATTFSTGCARISTIAVVVYTNPIAAIAPGTFVCENSVLSLQGSGGSSYQWSGPNGYSSAAQNNTLIAQLVSSGVYQLTVTAATGCQGSASRSVSVLAAPVIAASGATVCYGSPAVLTATGSVFFLWSGPNNFNAFTQSVTFPVASALVTGNYTMTGVSTVNSCSTVVVVNLSTMALPVVTSSNVSACLGQPATFTASGAASYTWTGPNLFNSTINNALIPVTNSLSIGVYTVTGTAANTCSNLASVTLTSMPLPVVTATGATVCLNEPATITAAGAQLYAWSGPNNFGSSLQNVNFQSVGFSVSGVYTVVGTASNSCNATASVNISVLSLPVVTTTNVSVCLGQPATLTGGGAVSYSWSGPALNTTGQNLFIPITNSLSVGVYTVVGTGINSCSNIATATLSAFPLPTLSITNPTVCYNQLTLLTVTGAQSYSWTGPSGTSSNAPFFLVLQANNAIPESYTVVGTDTNSCSSTATAVVVTFPLPQVTISSTQVKICGGESVTLTASGSPNYSWNPVGLPPVPVLVITPTISSTYTVQGKDGNNCVNTASILIMVSACTGIDEISGIENRILIYPNPNSGNFTIVSKTSIQLILVNTLGQLIKSIELNEKNNFKTSVSEIAEGIYYIISRTDGLSQKIIIEKSN